MSDELVVITSNQVSIFSSNPRETVAFATELAQALVPVIDKQEMYSVIQGKKHVKVEGWLTLGAMLGILPKELWVKELPDGSYEAHVDLVNKSGAVVGGASALCGIEEKRWRQADRYARRSMAVTRATAKAYRLAFAWIISLAGYQPTPAEEMPLEEKETKQSKPSTTSASPVTSSTIYNNKDPQQRKWLLSSLEEMQIPADQWRPIAEAMIGNPTTTSALSSVISILNVFADTGSSATLEASPIQGHQ